MAGLGTQQRLLRKTRRLRPIPDPQRVCLDLCLCKTWGLSSCAPDSERTVREFCEIAFSHADLDYRQYVLQDEKFYRPAEVDLLISDPSKARTTLNWQPTVSFKELITMMVDADMARQAHGGLFLNNFLQVKEKDVV